MQTTTDMTTDTKPNTTADYAEIRALVQSGKPEQIDQAVALLSSLAQEGHVDAQVDLGFLLASGQAAQHDLSEAARWFSMAAEAGSAQAQFNYGVLLRSGQGTRQDLPKAAKMFHLAAVAGNAEAAFNMAVVLRESGDESALLPEAIKLIEQFANDEGDLKCLYAAGLAQAEGWVAERDLPRAVPFLQKAAEQGHASAAYNLALILYYGEEGVKKDRAEAKRLFTLAAEKGHDRARQALADPTWETVV